MKTNWFVENIFPHVITKNDSNDSKGFETLDEAFVYRQNISDFYKQEHLDRTAYNRFLEEELKSIAGK